MAQKKPTGLTLAGSWTTARTRLRISEFLRQGSAVAGLNTRRVMPGVRLLFLMRENIFEILQSVDFEDYGSLRIPSIEKIEGNLHLYLEVVADEYPNLPRNIKIICHHPKASWVSLDEYYVGFEIAEDHVVLWPHTKPHISTSFYGSAEQPLAVVGALYERHRELAEDWIPFHQYMNPEMRLVELVAGGFGMLAEGAEPFILAYEKVMKSYGFSTSHTEPRGAGYLKDESKSELSVLIIGKSYVIASAF